MRKIKTTLSASQTPLRRRGTAFTLAEILITLSIIGVAAALTIPTLIQRTGNEEYVSRLMKAYSTLSQATEAIMTENGSVKTWAYDADNIYDLYKQHLRNSKECGSTSGCFNQGAYKHLNGKGVTGDWNTVSDYRKLILSDGVQLNFFGVYDKSCNTYGWESNNVCSAIFVDINGEKAPNTVGRDVFVFVIKEDGLYPSGCDVDETLSECRTEGKGTGCACRVIREGAMNY